MNSARLASLGEMAGGVAHEINNPLMIIQGKIEMIRRDSETSPAREQILKHTDRVSVAVERIARIVKSLREFAREGSFEPMQNFLVGNVVDDLKNLCQNRISNSKIDLRIDIDPPEAAVFGSSVQILQVLVSLVGNSIDSLFKQIELHRPMQENLTPALTEPNLPTPSLWISLSIKDLGHAIEFSVTDSGPALDTKIQDKLFQPFFTTKEIGQGTGIGLSTAMGIIKNHGGDIYYDAQSPHARFVFVLPKNDSKKIAA
jgi:C4-dicarboxylate-specific signal transduction histidine kinase